MNVSVRRSPQRSKIDRAVMAAAALAAVAVEVALMAVAVEVAPTATASITAALVPLAAAAVVQGSLLVHQSTARCLGCPVGTVRDEVAQPVEYGRCWGGRVSCRSPYRPRPWVVRGVSCRPPYRPCPPARRAACGAFHTPHQSILFKAGEPAARPAPLGGARRGAHRGVRRGVRWRPTALEEMARQSFSPTTRKMHGIAISRLVLQSCNSRVRGLFF